MSKYYIVALINVVFFSSTKAQSLNLSCVNCKVVLVDSIADEESWEGIVSPVLVSLNEESYNMCLTKRTDEGFLFDSLDLNEQSDIITWYFSEVISGKISISRLENELFFFALLEYVPSIVCITEDSILLQRFFDVMYNKIYCAEEMIPNSFAEVFICNPVFVSDQILRQGDKKGFLMGELYLLKDLLDSDVDVNKTLVQFAYDKVMIHSSDTIKARD